MLDVSDIFSCFKGLIYLVDESKPECQEAGFTQVTWKTFICIVDIDGQCVKLSVVPTLRLDEYIVINPLIRVKTGKLTS